MVCAEPAEINQATGLLKNSLGTPVPAAPPDAGTGDGATGDGGVNMVIGVAGGTVSGAGAEVVVPAGALAQDQTVSIQMATTGYPSLPAGAVLLSSVLAIEPHGQAFSKPVTVSVGFTARPETTPELITAAPGGSWASVAGATVTGASMQAMVAHFSFFAVIGLSLDGGAGGTTGTGGAAAGSSGTGGAGGCTSPQTSFGAIGQGDSNPNFRSGMGALGTNVMYIFSGYVAPLGDGGTQTWDTEVYVQAFDPKSGASKGPSRSIFAVPTMGLTSGGVPPFYVTNAAVAPTGEIAVLYYLAIGPESLYLAFLSPSTAGGSSDGGSADGLTYQKTVLVNANSPYVTFPGEPADHMPQVIWSNTSQTFIVSARIGNTYALYKYAPDGQAAGSIDPVPTNVSDNGVGSSIGSVGESGNLLGYAYTCAQKASACLTILDENENPVGQPIVLGDNLLGGASWAGVAGTAKGFVWFYDGQEQSAQFPNGFVGEAFVSTSTDGGIAGGDAGAVGAGTFPGFTFTPRPIDGRLVADDVGTGGGGGVGAALVYSDGSVKFAYVTADGAGHQGPYTAIPQGGGAGAMSITNFNGSFAISSYTPATNSAQVVATGICP